MISKPTKIIFIVLGFLLLLLLAAYLIFFSALRQDEDHEAIFRALPKVVFDSEVIRVNNNTYLAKNVSEFSREMESLGYMNHEQAGSGHFFTKNDVKYYSNSRMYTSHFMLFDEPRPY